MGGEAGAEPVAGGTPVVPPMTPPVVGAFSRPDAGLSDGTVGAAPAALRLGSPVPAAPLPSALFELGAPPPT